MCGKMWLELGLEMQVEAQLRMGKTWDLLEGTAWLEPLGEEPGVCFLSTVQHLPDHDATSSSQSTCSVQGLPSGCRWPWQGPRTPALRAQLPGFLGPGVSPPRRRNELQHLHRQPCPPAHGPHHRTAPSPALPPEPPSPYKGPSVFGAWWGGVVIKACLNSVRVKENLLFQQVS